MTLLKSATQITPNLIHISIHLSSLWNFSVTAGGGCPFAGGGAAGVLLPAADVNFDGDMESREPNKPKIDTHNDEWVITL